MAFGLIGVCGLAAARLASDARVAALLEAGAYAAAVAEARSRLSTDPDPAALMDLAWALTLNGQARHGEAQLRAREAWKRLESRLGPDHPLTAASRVAVGASLLLAGEPAQAHEALVPALSPLRAVADMDAAPLVGGLTWLAEIQIEQEQYHEALVSLEEAARHLGQLGSGRALATSRILDVQALATLYLGDAAGGHACAERALHARDATIGHHPESVRSLTLLGDADYLAGRIEEAGRHYTDAVEQSTALLAREHPLAIHAVSRLATWEADVGVFERAIARQKEAVESARVTFGPSHPRVADYLNDLALTYSLTGDPTAAIPLYWSALGIVSEKHGRESNAAATPLYNLALAYAALGDWPEAERRLADAFAIWTAVHGEKHIHVARVLADWADVLARAGRARDAIAFYERALALRESLSGNNHPATAAVRAGLAQALAATGRLREADTLAAAAQASLGQGGDRDRLHAAVLALRASIAAETGRWRDAMRFGIESDRRMRGHALNNVRFLAEPQALTYVRQAFAGRDVLLNLVARGRSSPNLRRAAFEALARDRNLVLDEIASRMAVARLHASGPSASVWARLFAARQQLATLLYRGVEREGPGGRALVREVAAEVAEVERDAARDGSAGRAAEPREPLIRDLAQALPVGTALVAFARYARLGETTERASRQDAYVAFVLRPNWLTPAAVDLGDAEQIDVSVRRWHAAVTSLARGPRLLRTRQDVWREGATLAARVWEPLTRHLRGVARAMVVPDGALTLLNFAALPTSRQRYLMDTGPVFHLLSAERDLLRPPREKQQDGGLLAVGAPASDSPSLRGASQSPVSACLDLWRLPSKPLPASGLEVRQIADIWRSHVTAPATLLLGAEASEAALKRLAPGARVLHIASHGFAVDSRCAETATRGTDGTVPVERPPVSPLLFSGLILAGADAHPPSQAASPEHDRDDGILTAEEIAGLDLTMTEWAVLAACDTGLGRIQDGEGVVGLRRALMVAGARTVIMSLWPVDDELTRRFMRDLYDARLAHRRDTADAVHEASRLALAHGRESSARIDPSLWAAFVAVGDWR